MIAQASTNFPKMRRMLLYFNFYTLFASFHAAADSDTGTGEIPRLDSSSLSLTDISPTVGEEGEDEEDEEEE